MPRTVEVLAALEPDRFEAIISASPKKFREELFRKVGVKKRSTSFTLKSSGAHDRTLRLQEALRHGEVPSAELIEELVRNYLYQRRELLADALNFFNVPHENGLTDQDLDFIGQVPEDKGRELKSTLEARHDPKDVELYLSFMSVPGA